MKMPFLKFYTRDWQADIGLRMCSLESRGFWIECLCIMHNAKRRGFMETPQGHPLTDEQTSSLMGTFKGHVVRCKEELALHGVFSVEEESGVMYCRRMVKAEEFSVKCSVAGKKGGGNPALQKKGGTKKKPETRNHISLNVTFKGTKITPEDAFDRFWKEYPKKKAKKEAQARFRKQVEEKTITDLSPLLRAITAQKNTDWKDTDIQFIPLPASWLNGERWNDLQGTEPTETPTKSRPTAGFKAVSEEYVDGKMQWLNEQNETVAQYRARFNV